MLHKLNYYIINPIKNLIRWFPIIWKDKDWDDHYIWEILKTKLKHQSEYIGRRDHHTRAQYDAQRMMLCVRLIEKIQDEYYEIEYMDYTIDNFDWIEVEGQPEWKQLKITNVSENLDEYLNKHKSKVRKVLADKKLQIFGLDDRKHKLAMNVGHYKQKQAQDILFKLMNRDIRGWWD